MARDPCPSREELASFVVGDLARDAFERIAIHAEKCETCERALGLLDGVDDPLLTGLRSPVKDDSEWTMPAGVRASLISLLSRDGAVPVFRPREGTRLGKFELIEQIGTGAFGQVFKANDTELDRPVAVKLLRGGAGASRDDVDRFLREARSAARLRHPGIVAVHETGQAEDGTPFLVEEFIQGTTLAAKVKDGPLQPQRAAEVVLKIADALAYAHEHGVVHRDVKPSNIMVDPEGQPHLMDFGLAKRETDDPPETVEGQVLGTPAYMSPEQARGESRRVDGRSDVYSLGVVFYELLTGERPFHGNRRMLLLQVLEDEPRPPRRLNDRIPRDLETICLKAMAKTSGRRYGTASDLAADLRRFLRNEPVKARPAGWAERLWRWCRRNPVPSSLLLAVTAGAIFGFWRLSQLSEDLVQASALEGAAQQSEMLHEVNTVYSAEVADRVRGVPVTHDYIDKTGAIPLPATLMIVLGRSVNNRGQTGVQVRLYTDKPFRPREDGVPRDDFEWDALERLRADPETPVYRFEEWEGKPVLRYATTRRMQEACVRCHNTHPASPKKDWKEGEVPGVLEVIRPLEGDVKRTREGLRGTAIQMGVTFGSLLGVCGLIVVLTNRRRYLPAKELT
jgi:hypothetical protein